MLFQLEALLENRSTSPQATAPKDLMTAGIIGFSHSEFDYKNTLGEEMQGYLGHLVLMVEESVDARSGAGVPNLHALVRRAESSRGEKENI